MTPEQLKADLQRTLADRQLLGHPFYRRWVAGELTLADVGAYAGQYRHFETALPGMLRRLGDGLPAGPAADLVGQNLADEESNPAPHAMLFEGFASAVGAPASVPASPATAQLIATYEELIDAGSPGGLSAFVAYEMQAASIAASKADGLRRMGASACVSRNASWTSASRRSPRCTGNLSFFGCSIAGARPYLWTSWGWRNRL